MRLPVGDHCKSRPDRFLEHSEDQIKPPTGDRIAELLLRKHFRFGCIACVLGARVGWEVGLASLAW
jgi:hypothetical protein